MRYLALIPLLALMLVCLTGCNEEQIARAEAIQKTAEESYAKALAYKADADAALADAHALAQRMDAKDGAALIERMQSAAAKAGELLPIAKNALDTSAAAVTAAKESQASGASTWGTLGAVALALLTGASGTGLLTKRAQAVTDTALSIVGQFSRHAAAADTDAQVDDARFIALNKARQSADPRVAVLVAAHLPPAVAA